MPVLLLLMIFCIGSTNSLPRPTGAEFLKNLSFEFKVNEIADFSPQLEDLLRNAEYYHKNLSVIQSCDQPVEFDFGRCNKTFFRHKHGDTNLTLYLDEQGILFLKNTLENPCFEQDDSKEITFLVYSSHQTLCRFDFKLVSYHPSYLNEYFTLMKTPIKNWYYYQRAHSPPELLSSRFSSTTFIIMGIFVGLVVVCFFSMLIGKCLTSDGLGEDEKDADVHELENLDEPAFHSIGFIDDDMVTRDVEPAEVYSYPYQNKLRPALPNSFRLIQNCQSTDGSCDCDESSNGIILTRF
ncbi:hypothetical protein GCK72_025150 [Caenorhabditis remanei]|uniref:Uncharacterized protein n=1 Tax=Caenorhabditis remanei TaxID=31234 RepID=A0A6A5G1K9_CAERE|nr:hypothetical protein GCK72_025150 [Caenorhabditis remanei]KAF1748683.1 hypothetical protein GCK72_025150 [Caenorhabditis remanei]